MQCTCEWCFETFENPVPTKYCPDKDCKRLAVLKKAADNLLPGERVLTCKRCTHVWIQRQTGPVPKYCPNCHRLDWTEEKLRTEHFCKRCEQTWVGRSTPLPTICARCHSPLWYKDRVRPNPKKVIQELAEKLFQEMLVKGQARPKESIVQSEQTPIQEVPFVVSEESLDAIWQGEKIERVLEADPDIALLEEAFSHEIQE